MTPTSRKALVALKEPDKNQQNAGSGNSTKIAQFFCWWIIRLSHSLTGVSTIGTLGSFSQAFGLHTSCAKGVTASFGHTYWGSNE